MKPNNLELEHVGDCLLLLTDIDYTPEQVAYLTPVLESNALDINDMEMAKVFNNQREICDAIRGLHDFAFQFQNEEDIYEAFQQELSELLVRINTQYSAGKASC